MLHFFEKLIGQTGGFSRSTPFRLRFGQKQEQPGAQQRNDEHAREHCGAPRDPQRQRGEGEHEADQGPGEVAEGHCGPCYAVRIGVSRWPTEIAR